MRMYSSISCTTTSREDLFRVFSSLSCSCPIVLLCFNHILSYLMDQSELFFTCSPNEFGVLIHVSCGFSHHILYGFCHIKLYVLIIIPRVKRRFMTLHRVDIAVMVELVCCKIIHYSFPEKIINKNTQVALF